MASSNPSQTVSRQPDEVARCLERYNELLAKQQAAAAELQTLLRGDKGGVRFSCWRVRHIPAAPVYTYHCTTDGPHCKHITSRALLQSSGAFRVLWRVGQGPLSHATGAAHRSLLRRVQGTLHTTRVLTALLRRSISRSYKHALLPSRPCKLTLTRQG